ncbi:MAG: MCE family protein [Calditrichaeota bacterium]|nr:MCE family protein [Calditrichota bacterium]
MREVTPAQRARLGLFLLISGSILVILLLIITGGKLLERRDQYSIRYKDVSVSGLEIGAQVKYHGVRVGRVERIAIDPKEIETIVVTISVDHNTPITTDVKAITSALSLTGIKVIELTGGTSEAVLIKPGSEIPAGPSTFDIISGKAEAVSEKLELVLTNLANLTGGENQERLLLLIDNTALILNDVHIMLVENSPRVSNTIQNLEFASERLAEIASSPALERTIANLDTTTSEIRRAQIGAAVDDLRLALQQARNTLTHIDLTLLKGRHDLLTSLEVLRESLDSFNEFARTISEDPSLLLRGTKAEEVSGPLRGSR